MAINKLKIKQPTCPWWFLFTFDNPLRKLYQDPDKILTPYIKSGDTAVDLGCGMGYFSIPLAALVGTHGKVISVDLQEEMLAGLRRRAERANLFERIITHQSTQNQIGITSPVDFVLVFWMAHEVRDPGAFFAQIHAALKEGGRMLLAEPFIHVSKKAFRQTLQVIEGSGFKIETGPKIGFSRSILARK
jgi:ubiquinone/menaquinone biosynthesis C-methylase UbiE